MISKELLSELFNKKVKEFVVEKNELRYILEDDNNSIPELYYINIYELAHKCKEWAFSKKYELVSYPSILWNDYQCVAIDNVENKTEPFRADTEPEAVIQACEWILKEIKK